MKRCRLVCIFSFLFSLIGWAHAGVISKVTHVDLGKKDVFILHDTHVDASMPTITRGGRTYKTADVAAWQKETWHTFFSRDVQNFPGTKSLYLEWKDALVKKSFHSIHTMVKSGNYSPSLHFGFGEKDFFFVHFIDPFMNPKKNEDRLIALFNHVENVDMRDAVNDALLPLLANPMMWSSVITSAPSNWFDMQCAKVNTLLHHLKPVVSENVFGKLTDHARTCETRLRAVFKRLGIESDITRLPYALDNLSSDELSALYDDYMQFACQLFDIPALHRILDDPHALVIVYCGGAHAQRLVGYLQEDTYACRECNTMESDALVKNSDVLYDKIATFFKDTMQSNQTEQKTLEKNTTTDQNVTWMQWLLSLFSWLFDSSLDADYTIDSLYAKKHADMPFVHQAAALGDDKMLVYLYNKHNADLTLCNKDGNTILQIAENTHNTNMAHAYTQCLKEVIS